MSKQQVYIQHDQVFMDIYQVKSTVIYFTKLKFGVLRLLLSLNRFVMCMVHGCTNRAVQKGICVIHGGCCCCIVAGCPWTTFQKQKCSYHYRSSLGEQDVWHENPTTAGTSSTRVLTNGASAVTTPTIVSFDDNIFQSVIQFAGGCNNWENVITFPRVCKSWRRILENQLSFIGLVKMRLRE